MNTVGLKEPISFGLHGQVELSVAPHRLDIDDALKVAKIIHKEDNLIVDTAEKVIARLMMRDTADYLPYYIHLGTGGDYAQEGKYDAEQRVAPATTDTEIRESLIKLPIVKVDRISDNQWTYIAIADPSQALTTSLNEMTLETFNGTLISHYVTLPEAGAVRSKRLVKTSLFYLIVRWTFTLTLA